MFAIHGLLTQEIQRTTRMKLCREKRHSVCLGGKQSLPKAGAKLVQTALPKLGLRLSWLVCFDGRDRWQWDVAEQLQSQYRL